MIEKKRKRLDVASVCEIVNKYDEEVIEDHDMPCSALNKLGPPFLINWVRSVSTTDPKFKEGPAPLTIHTNWSKSHQKIK